MTKKVTDYFEVHHIYDVIKQNESELANIFF